MIKRVLVAGATGYLGKYVVREFKQQGFWVRAPAQENEKLGKLGPFGKPAVLDYLDDIFIGKVNKPETLDGFCDGIKEWKLFHLPGGETEFLLFHIPLLFPVLYRIVLINHQALAGLILSFLVSVNGLFAFLVHTFFLQRGWAHFKTPVSLGILWSILLVSLVQFGLTVLVLI